MNISDRIKVVRDDSGLSQQAFADKVKIGPSAIAKLEKGVNNPSEQTIQLICREFHISYNWLKNGVEPMKMPAKEADKYNIDRIMTGDNEFVKSVFRGLADLPPEAWAEIEGFVGRYLTKKDRT